MIGDLALIALAAAAATWALVLGARHLGLVDDGAEAPERKSQRRAVPLVGGLGLFAALLVARLHTAPELGALAGALALGVLDDRLPRGLRPGAKLAGQLVVGLGCAAAVSAGGVPWSEALALGLLAVAAMNLINTFDHADGAATGVVLVGTWPLPWLSAALLGWLPFNLVLRRRDAAGGSTPWAYLGDGGSHLLGVLVALEPRLWGVLALPALDLARLSILRWRSGSRPWIGDRRHLGHRFQAAGVGPLGTAAWLALLAAPAALGVACADLHPAALGSGLAATGLGFALALRGTPDAR